MFILTDVVAMVTYKSHLTSPSLKLSESAGPGGIGGGSGSCWREERDQNSYKMDSYQFMM